MSAIPLTFSPLPQHVTGRPIRIALAIAFVLACALEAAFTVPGAGPDLPLRLGSALAFAAVCVALVVYRPAIFPLTAYLATVPFDNLLQTGGGTVTKLLALASAAVILLVLLGRGRAAWPPLAVAGWGAFLVWSAASFAWADSPSFGLTSFLQVAGLFAFFAVVAMLRVRPDELRWLFVAVLVGGMAASAYGIVMYAGGHVARTDALSQRLDIAIGNAYINADHFAGALVFPAAIALVALLRTNGLRALLATGAFALLLAGILVSATRGSLVAVAVMAAYLAIVERRRLRIAIAAVIGLAASFAVPNIWLRFLDPEQGDLGGRGGVWAIGLDAFRRHWLIGDGTGNFRLAYTQSYLHVPQHGAFFHPWVEDSHNLLINTGAELGVIGLVLVVAAWWLQFRVTAPIPRLSPLGAARSTVEAGTLGLFVVAMTVDLMWYKYLWIAFMLAVLTRNAMYARRTVADG